MANKTDLVNKVTELSEVTLSKKDATSIVDAVFEAIQALTIEHGKLQIFGHGNYEVRERAARKGVNPKLLKELKEQGYSDEDAKQKATIDIDASKVPAFKPAKAFKDSLK
ncbi:MAG TPA: HU family DNA-binding protein [Pseudoneobacillus sp.]|nr:HU family DNA-binding protein [Pseudoneobacillus sp.]